MLELVVNADDVIDPEVEKLEASLPDGNILLLENVRFYKEEEKIAPDFSKKLTSLAELYMSDAFGTAHRAHASTEGVTKFLKPLVAGFLLQREIAVVDEYLNCSLNLLELFISIGSSLAYLGQARLLLAHALSLVENLLSSAIEHLKPTRPRSLDKDSGKVKLRKMVKKSFTLARNGLFMNP
ncbi:phosphoglycerate kinase, chloroplastic-like [Juglans microcarpa x Juglans regia]|uniref:phosphoglycerate kinase, chloroplastic-like n=1 Tax=Juglans microcarpa x Juglans regia TaxID=2249226 RepID=UPI001B7EEAF7|nr:phosphoglycerate kinase, chloroplastic-like [Juglans microcarpa x Juglans regia]